MRAMLVCLRRPVSAEEPGKTMKVLLVPVTLLEFNTWCWTKQLEKNHVFMGCKCWLVIENKISDLPDSGEVQVVVN